ncbi:MAG: T9SS type A sorting domain-containing protein [Bacteroidota bacterium]|jgi:hypothetical protein
MKQYARTILVALLVNLLAHFSANSQPILKSVDGVSLKLGLASAQSIVRYGSVDINNLWLHVANDGRHDTIMGSGMTYPYYEGGLLYGDNLVWSGKVIDGRFPEIRTGGGTYLPGVRPGIIVSKGVAEDPQSESVRVFRFRPDYLTGDLTLDAAASNEASVSKVTPEMTSTVRESYKKDLSEWPWKKGAPFIDRNHNGVMDPGENPGLQNSSQVLWYSYNDLDEAVCNSFGGCPSIGLEVQATLWAYKGAANLDDVIFKRYRIIYKGTSLTSSAARIDSMFLTQWFDPDIGSSGNDLGGCDSLLDLGYAYNGTYNGNDQDVVYSALGLPTPGVGYIILQGPLVPGSGGESAVFNFASRTGFKNLSMSSCCVHMTGLGDGINEYWGVRNYFYWNIARGFQPALSGTGKDTVYSFTPWLDNQKNPSKFMYYGDPESRTGWIASRPTYFWGNNSQDFAGGDARLYMNMGPFTMALGDTQEVVVAIIASPAPTSAENATWLKNRAKYVRAIYPNLGDYVAAFVTSVSQNSNVPQEFALEQNFPNPFNPTTQIRFTNPQAGQVKLSIFDLLGREVKVLYQGTPNAGEHTLTWDSRNASGEAMPSGVYFCRLTQGDRQITRKMLLIR